MIKHLVVTGLYGKFDFDLDFNEDLNILTGRNGSGKTTILKLLWYLISGNLERITPEIRFDTVEIETSDFDLKMKVDRSSENEVIHLDWKIGKGGGNTRFSPGFPDKNYFIPSLNQKIRMISKSSIFFPTFRRIEGGYSIPSSPKRSALINSLPDAVFNLATQISTDNHRFVATVSTHDIVELLTQAYADTHISTNALHTDLSIFITKRIHDYSIMQEKTETENLKYAVSILKEIQAEVDQVSKERENLLRPFTVLSELVGQIFQYGGIRITQSITLGEAEEAISSEKLSSGEKQMLSFLCYNAFMKNSPIFIDEPELSLHVDWQRVLFPTLLKQGTGNQFIVATHSPMIYATYPDKELILDEDKGGN